MKCEGCSYTHGYEWDDKDNYVDNIGEFGEFYTLPISLEKPDGYGNDKKASVKGCPSCKIVFLSET